MQKVEVVLNFPVYVTQTTLLRIAKTLKSPFHILNVPFFNSVDTWSYHKVALPAIQWFSSPVATLLL